MKNRNKHDVIAKDLTPVTGRFNLHTISRFRTLSPVLCPARGREEPRGKLAGKADVFGYGDNCRLNRATGFTLIEVLVVTVIAGIVLALAAANFFPDEQQAARRETGRIALALEQARDAAVFGGTATAVSVEDARVLQWRRDDMNAWQPDNTAQSAISIAQQLAVTSLSIGAAQVANNALVTFLPDGVGVPFELRLSYRGISSAVIGDALGNVRVQFAPEESP